MAESLTVNDLRVEGWVGIGTASPGAKLHIHTTGQDALRITGPDATQYLNIWPGTDGVAIDVINPSGRGLLRTWKTVELPDFSRDSTLTLAAGLRRVLPL